MRVSAPAELTLGLAERASALDELPDDILERARQSMLDWFAVTLGGSSEDGPATLLAILARGAGEDPARPPRSATPRD